MPDSVSQKILKLSPEQFENLVFECVRARGMKNVVWRTPGADGGRDIEGATFDVDVTGATDARKWYVECKRYSTSLDWPTVRGKIAYAESNDADFLLVATTATPSPNCETEISKWNSRKIRPQVRFWRGYDLPNIIRGLPHVATMFGLASSEKEINASLIPLAEVATRAAQSSYARVYFNPDDLSGVETVAALSELFSVRLGDLRDFGRPAMGPAVRGVRLFDWLTVDGDLAEWEDTGIRAMLSFLRHEFQAKSGAITASKAGQLILSLSEPRRECVLGLPHDREIVSFWSRISVSKCDVDDTWVLERRAYVQ